MRLLLLVPLLAVAPLASAQNAEADAAVRSVVTQLFDAMRAKDTTALRATLHPEARLMTAAHENGQRSVQEADIDRFIATIAGALVFLDERIPDEYPVLVDDGLAVAWTPYRFYAGEQFSHCGTNAFMLALGDEGWRIVQVMDTRRRDCEGG